MPYFTLCVLSMTTFPGGKSNVVNLTLGFLLWWSDGGELLHHAKKLLRLTTSALAKTMGRPKAEMTMPVVRKMASSLQALLAESVSSTTLREMQ